MHPPNSRPFACYTRIWRAVLPAPCINTHPADLHTHAICAFVTQRCRCIRSSPLLGRSAISNVRALIRMPRRLLVPRHHSCNGTNKTNALTPSARNRVFLLRCRTLRRCRIFNNRKPLRRCSASIQNNQILRLTKKPCHNNEARSEVRASLHTQ